MSNTPSPAENRERASGVLGFFKLEARVFLPVIIVGLVFLVAIIVFAITR